LKKRENSTDESAQISREYDVALIGIDSEATLGVKDTNNVPFDIWIGDSGASCHVTQNDIGMFDTVASEKHIIVGGGSKLPILKTGKLKVAFEGRDGIYQEIVLQDVNYVPDMGMSLFSFNRAIDSGADLFSENKTMVI
jgi:hypothetical protein